MIRPYSLKIYCDRCHAGGPVGVNREEVMVKAELMKWSTRISADKAKTMVPDLCPACKE